MCRRLGCTHEPGGRKEFCSPICAFWDGVDKQGDDECWLWTKKRSGAYGLFKYRGIAYQAHRMSYAIKHDEEYSRTLFNVCGEKMCVNPDHWSPNSKYKWLHSWRYK